MQRSEIGWRSDFLSGRKHFVAHPFDGLVFGHTTESRSMAGDGVLPLWCWRHHCVSSAQTPAVFGLAPDVPPPQVSFGLMYSFCPA